VAVTGDSPEKQRGGMSGHCHGVADQAWSSGAVAAAVVARVVELVREDSLQAARRIISSRPRAN
jgi:hypothetical protein